jgi:hypothetical protein
MLIVVACASRRCFVFVPTPHISTLLISTPLVSTPLVSTPLVSYSMSYSSPPRMEDAVRIPFLCLAAAAHHILPLHLLLPSIVWMMLWVMENDTGPFANVD